MKTLGFLISHKNNERRRALIPEDIMTLDEETRACMFFEEGYGQSIGLTDDDYRAAGVSICSREEALACDVLVDVKLGDADYLDQLGKGKYLVGWAHSVQNIDFTSKMLEDGHTVLAWEEIFENGRYIFYRNREIAGEAAILQGLRYSARLPYDCKVAIIGNGQTGKGAFRILAALGAEVDIFGRKQEQLFKDRLGDYDVLVNCVMWDTHRTDRLIYRSDLARLKPGAIIIDVSCDPYLEIETSHPTTIDDPVYTVDGVIHYAVDNTPAMYPISVTKELSKHFVKYYPMIARGELPENLQKAVVIEEGHIKDQNIVDFREARGVFCQ